MSRRLDLIASVVVAPPVLVLDEPTTGLDPRSRTEILGLLIGKEEAAGQLSVLVLPVAMLSNVFVPTTGMPAWLRTIADWNPVSAVAAAVRALCGNPTAPTNGTWPLEDPVVASLGWTALLLLVFVPLCTARYARPRA